MLFHFQGRRNRRVQILDQDVQVPHQLRAPPGGQSQRVGLVPIVKVVDVAPVVGLRLVRRLSLQERFDNRPLAHARRPQGVQIVALAANRDTEPDGVQCASLSHKLAQIVQFRRRLEVQMCGIATPAQLLWRQSLDLVHGDLSLRYFLPSLLIFPCFGDFGKARRYLHGT